MSKASFHESFDEGEAPAGPSNRSFGMTVGGILLAIAALRLLLDAADWLQWALLGAGLPLLLLALVRPAWLALANRLWMRLGLLLFTVVNPVVMLLMYLVCIVPAGLVMKVIGRDPLTRRFDPQATSYWVDKRPTEIDKPMKFQF